MALSTVRTIWRNASIHSTPSQHDRDDVRRIDSLRELPKSRFATRPCLTAIQPRRPRPLVFSHIEVYKMVESIATELREAGVRPSTACAFLLPPSIEAIVYFLALQWIGAVAIPLDPAVSPDILTALLLDVSALTVVTPFLDDDERDEDPLFTKVAQVCNQARLVHWLIARSTNRGVFLEMCGRRASEHPAWAGGAADFKYDPADPSFCLPSLMAPTGLTTAMSHGRAAVATQLFADCYSLSEELSTTLLLPLHSVHGLMTVLASLLTGGNIIILPSAYPDPADIAKHVSACKVNWLAIESEKLNPIIAALTSTQIPDLSFIRVVGPQLKPDIIENASSLLEDISILSSYGSIETCGIATTNTIIDNKTGTVGKPVGKCLVEIIDPATNESVPSGEEGCIAVSGGHADVAGALGENEINSMASKFVTINDKSYYITGDTGAINSEGYLSVSVLSMVDEKSAEERIQMLIAEKQKALEIQRKKEEEEKDAARQQEEQDRLKREEEERKKVEDEERIKREEEERIKREEEEIKREEEERIKREEEERIKREEEEIAVARLVEEEALRAEEQLSEEAEDRKKSDGEQQDRGLRFLPFGNLFGSSKSKEGGSENKTSESEETRPSDTNSNSEKLSSANAYIGNEEDIGFAGTNEEDDSSGVGVSSSSDGALRSTASSSMKEDSDEISSEVAEDSSCAEVERSEMDNEMMNTIMERLSSIEDNQKRLEEEIEQAHRTEMENLRALVEQVQTAVSTAAAAAVAPAVKQVTAVPKEDMDEMRKAVEQAVTSAQKSSRDTAAAARAAKEAAAAANKASKAQMDLVKRQSRKAEDAVEKRMVVSLEEVEESIRLHPSIKTARAFGRPDERFGWEVFCVVDLKAGARISETWLKLHAQSLLAAGFVPKQFFHKEGLKENEDRTGLAEDRSLKRVSEVSGFSSQGVVKSPAWAPKLLS